MPYDTISIKLKKPSNIKNELLMDRDTQKTYRINNKGMKNPKFKREVSWKIDSLHVALQ